MTSTIDNFTELREALDQFRELFKRHILTHNTVNHSASFLKTIVEKDQWSTSEAFRIYNIIKPYTRQLKEIEFDFNSVPLVILV